MSESFEKFRPSYAAIEKPSIRSQQAELLALFKKYSDKEEDEKALVEESIDREHQIERYYQTIDKKVGEVMSLYRSIQEVAGSSDAQALRAELSRSFDQLLRSYPLETQRRVRQYFIEKTRDLQQSTARALAQIRSHPFQSKYSSIHLPSIKPRPTAQRDETNNALERLRSESPDVEYLVRMREAMDAAIAKKSTVEGYESRPASLKQLHARVEKALHMPPNSVDPNDYHIEYDGISAIVTLGDKLSKHFTEKLRASGLFCSKEAIIILNSQGDDIAETRRHEIIHNYLDLTPKELPSLRKMYELGQRLDEIILADDFETIEDNAEAIELWRQIATELDGFFEISVEELLASQTQLKNRANFGPDMLFRFFAYRFDDYINRSLPKESVARNVLASRLLSYYEGARILSVSICELLRNNREDYLMSLFVLFSPLKAKRWESVTRRLFGDAYDRTAAELEAKYPYKSLIAKDPSPSGEEAES